MKQTGNLEKKVLINGQNSHLNLSEDEFSAKFTSQILNVYSRDTLD